MWTESHSRARCKCKLKCTIHNTEARKICWPIAGGTVKSVQFVLFVQSFMNICNIFFPFASVCVYVYVCWVGPIIVYILMKTLRWYKSIYWDSFSNAVSKHLNFLRKISSSSSISLTHIVQTAFILHIQFIGFWRWSNTTIRIKL